MGLLVNILKPIIFIIQNLIKSINFLYLYVRKRERERVTDEIFEYIRGFIFNFKKKLYLN
jgi:hypothetical protein